MKNIFLSSFAGVFFALCFSAVADTRNYSGDRIDLIEDIYEKAVALSPEVLSSAETPRHSQAYITVGRQHIALNAGFYDLVRGWIRLYRHELEQYCPCNINENELVRSAKDHTARGFFSSKVAGPLMHFAEHTGESTALLSTKYGKVAGALKASSEVAEHTLSIFLGGKGISFFCNVIDVVILFLFRKTQIYTRVFSNSKSLNQNRLWMIFRLAYLNRLMRIAQEKVFFYMETAEINHQNLTRLNREGASKKNQRAKWLNNISQKAGPLLSQIQELDARLEQESISEKERRKLLKKRQKLYKKIENITTVYKKSFFGKRYKRFSLLKSRRGRPDHLKGVSFADTATAENWFWPLSIQENILERALRQEADKPLAQNQKSALPEDEIRTGLTREFIQKISDKQEPAKEHIRHIEHVLMDIDNIFNPSLTLKERYLLVHIIETGLIGFFKYYLNLMSNRLISSTTDIGFFGKIRLQGKLRGRFEYYVLAYSDFLRTTAMTKNKKAIAPYKHSAMESFLLFFEYLNELSHIARSSHTKPELWAKLDQNLKRIEAFQIQREKRTAYSWIPFRSPLPYCRNLLRVLR